MQINTCNTSTQAIKIKNSPDSRLVRDWKFLKAIVSDQSLPDSASKVAFMLLERRNSNDPFSFPSYSTIARDASVSRSTAVRAVEALKAGGWFVVEGVWIDKGGMQRQTANRYRPIWERASGPAPAQGSMPSSAEIAPEAPPVAQDDSPADIVWESGPVQFTDKDLLGLVERVGSEQYPSFIASIQDKSPEWTSQTWRDEVESLIAEAEFPF